MVTKVPSGAGGGEWGRLGWVEGVYGNSVLFPQFCSEPETSLKYRVHYYYYFLDVLAACDCTEKKETLTH